MEKKKVSKQRRIIGIVIIVISLVLIITGISMIVKANSLANDNMWDDSWFSDNSKSDGIRFGGIACLMFGVFIGIFGLSVTFINIDPKYQIERVKKVIDSTGIFELNTKFGKKEKTGYTCPYCGTYRKDKMEKCPACGAGYKEEKVDTNDL